MAQTVTSFYMYENTGSTLTVGSAAKTMAYENIGYVQIRSQRGVGTAYENIGVTLIRQTEPAFAFENIIIKPLYVGWGNPIK